MKNRLEDYENGKKALTLPELNELHVLLEAFKEDAARQSVEASEKGWR